MHRTVRAIKWFSKEDNYIVGKEEIKNFDLEFFKKIFNHTDDDDPYIYGGCYDVTEEHVEVIQPLIEHKIDLQKYSYFFGTYLDNS